MTRTLSAAEAKSRFDELAERIAETGERVVVELSGHGRIAMISSDELDRLPLPRVQPTSAIVRLEALHAMVRKELNGRRLTLIQWEVIRQIRDEE